MEKHFFCKFEFERKIDHGKYKISDGECYEGYLENEMFFGNVKYRLKGLKCNEYCFTNNMIIKANMDFDFNNGVNIVGTACYKLRNSTLRFSDAFTQFI